MGREHVALIQYASPAVVPKCLQIVAAINYSGGTPPNGMRQVSSHWYNPGEAIPGRYRRVGAVTYAIGAARPSGLVTVAAMQPDPEPYWPVGPFTAANTPAVGAEQVLNGTFDSDTAWTKGLGWTINGGVAHYNEPSGQTTLGNTGGTGATVGSWYVGQFDVVAWSAQSISLYFGNGFIGNRGALGTTKGVARAGNTSVALFISPTLSGTLDVDNVTIKPLTLSSLLDVKPDNVAAGVFEAAVTLAAGLQGGVAATATDSNPANGWFAYHDGTNAYLDKLVAGTWTSVISAAATYVAGATIRVVRSGNNFSLYYNGTQVGTTQAIADLPALYHFGGFRTDTSVTVANILHSP